VPIDPMATESEVIRGRKIFRPIRQIPPAKVVPFLDIVKRLLPLVSSPEATEEEVSAFRLIPALVCLPRARLVQISLCKEIVVVILSFIDRLFVPESRPLPGPHAEGLAIPKPLIDRCSKLHKANRLSDALNCWNHG